MNAPAFTAGLRFSRQGPLWIAAALMALALLPAKAESATFTAACTGETGDTASLIAALNSANTITGADTVQLGEGCVYALKAVDNHWYGPNGLPAISSEITVEGNGATILRLPTAPKFRLLFVGADPSSAATPNYVSPGPGRLTLRGITLVGGLAEGGDSYLGGGGAGMGGAVFNQGTLTIEGSTLVDNSAVGGASGNIAVGDGGGGMGSSSVGEAGGGFGGGTFIGGGTGGAGNGFGAGGGAGFRVGENGGSATAGSGGAGGGPSTGLGGRSGQVAGGATGDGAGGGDGCCQNGTGGGFGSGGGEAGGGGVGGGGGSSDVGAGGGFGGGGGYGDLAGGFGGFGGGGGVGGGGGGGEPPGAPGFGGGSATEDGGGGGAGMGGAIFNMQGRLTVLDSTLAGNSAVGGKDEVSDHGKGIGGAVFNLSGEFSATGSTFAGNSAAYFSAQIYNLVYDGSTPRVAQTTLRDTIVAAGVGPVDIASDKTDYISPPQPPGASADIDVSQFDLVRAMSAQEHGTITGQPLTADPLLAPLADNGGPTKTMALEPGSPAIDTGSAFGLSVDQRGDPRPSDFPSLANQGDGSDIGAFEAQSPPGSAVDSTPPVFLGPVRVTPPAFAVGQRGRIGRAAMNTVYRRGKTHLGTTFRYKLSESAQVHFSIERRRKSAKPCGQRSRTLDKSHACSNYVTVGTLSRLASNGENAVPFSGRIGRKALSPGRYRASLVATDKSGNRSQAKRVAFRIIGP